MSEAPVRHQKGVPTGVKLEPMVARNKTLSTKNKHGEKQMFNCLFLPLVSVGMRVGNSSWPQGLGRHVQCLRSGNTPPK